MENRFQIIQIILDTNHLIIQFTKDDHQTKENHEISHKTGKVDQTVEIINIEKTIQDRLHADLNCRLKPVPIHTPGIDTNPMIDLENLHIIETEIIPTIEIETIQMIEIKDIKTIDHEIFRTTDQTIKDHVITTVKIDHAIIHKIEIQIITINKETTLNHRIEITHVIKILNKNIQVIHQNIKVKSIRYKQLKKLNQTPPPFLIIQKAQNCN